MIASELYKKILKRPGLYNIQAIENIPSILEHGLLCHELAEELNEHTSIAMESVQGKRTSVKVPNGLRLHQYANLYFDFWNPMLSSVRDRNEEICILRFKIIVLDIDGTIVTDRNAASTWVNFYNPYEGLEMLDFDTIYRKGFAPPYIDVNPDDHFTAQNIKVMKMAEVLVPYSIPSDCIDMAAVINDEAYSRLVQTGFDKQIKVLPRAFF